MAHTCSLKVKTIIFFYWCVVVPVQAANIFSGEQIAESALMSDSWEEVYQSLFQHYETYNPDCSKNVVYRYVLGHAALATNNESIAIKSFYCHPSESSDDSAEFIQWQNWSASFLKRNPQNPFAHYIHGDALARQAKYTEAIAVFSQSIDQKPNDYMARNARGVTHFINYLQTNDYDSLRSAHGDWVTLINHMPNFHDARINNGIAKIKNSGSLQNAIQQFENVLLKQPTHTMAIVGLATAYGASGDYANYKKQIKKLRDVSTNVPFLSSLDTNTVKEQKDMLSKRGVYSVGFKTDIGIPGLGMKFGNFEFNTTIDMQRGGIYLYLKRGENLITTNGKAQMVGTWVTLNYPLNTNEGDLNNSMVGK